MFIQKDNLFIFTTCKSRLDYFKEEINNNLNINKILNISGKTFKFHGEVTGLEGITTKNPRKGLKNEIYTIGDELFIMDFTDEAGAFIQYLEGINKLPNAKPKNSTLELELGYRYTTDNLHEYKGAN